MATVYFLGRADAVAQVTTIQVTAFDGATTYSLTVGGRSVSVLGDTDVNTTASNLADAWNAATHPYFTQVTASSATDTVTLTSDVAGLPFVVTSSVNGGTGTIGSPSTTTGSAGPNHWDTAANWSGGSVPANSDVAVIANTATPILWGLDQSAVTLTKLLHLRSHTGRIGLPPRSLTTAADGSTVDATADEYRDTYLKIGATTAHLGLSSGNATDAGSDRVKIDFGSVQTAVTVFGSAASPADDGLEAVRLLGTHASNVLHVAGGSVGVATENAAEAATLATVNTSSPAGAATATVNLGAGCTLTTVNAGGGDVTNRGADVTTLIQSGGSYTALGSGAHTTLDVRDGTCAYHSDGTITNLKVVGAFDTSGDPRPKTVTNAEAYAGATINADTGSPLSVTFTNGIDLVECGLEDVTILMGEHYTISPAAI